MLEYFLWALAIILSVLALFAALRPVPEEEVCSGDSKCVGTRSTDTDKTATYVREPVTREAPKFRKNPPAPPSPRIVREGVPLPPRPSSYKAKPVQTSPVSDDTTTNFLLFNAAAVNSSPVTPGYTPCSSRSSDSYSPSSYDSGSSSSSCSSSDSGGGGGGGD